MLGIRIAVRSAAMPLLERETLLARLRAQWVESCTGPGRLVFIEGEAGIGKSSLLRAFAKSLHGEATVLWGACDAMLTPQPLGALEDMVRPLSQAGGALARVLAGLTGEGGDRRRLFVALLDLIAERPTLAVIEDLHWADEATLDLLRYLGRRLARTRSLLLASLRSDEVVPEHPLRAVLGDLATTGALRLALPPLSLEAVRSLCAGSGLDAAGLHRETGGNPFFVTEVLAAGARQGQSVPATVADAVLARAGRLSSPSARAVLDAAAVAGPRVEPWLLYELTAAESACVEECLATGVLCAEGAIYTFRHELARQAVLQAMTPTRTMSLHRLVLQSLAANESTRHAAARLALHAAGAADAEAVLRWAPRAAHEAAARGAHRQSAEHWHSALQHAGDATERARMLDAYAVSAHWSGQMDGAITALRDAARLWREAGQPEAAAASLAEQATLCLLSGQRAQAQAAMDEARALVAAQTDVPAAWKVHGTAARLRLADGDAAEAATLAEQVLSAAQRAGDTDAVIDNLKTLGSALMVLGRVAEGAEHLERGFAMALERHDEGAAAQMLASLGTGFANALQLAPAEDYARRGIEFCGDRDLDAPRLFQTATLAHVLMLKGAWEEAAAAAQAVTSDPRATVVARIAALTVLGRLRARRGEEGAWALLDEARDLAAQAGAMRTIAPARARAEAAWIEGRNEDAGREAAAPAALAVAGAQTWLAAELLMWQRLAAADASPVPAFCADHPCALEATGHWCEAAEAWRACGCLFETARALMQGDESAQRKALAALEAMGARPLAERVRRRLRAAGARGLPRGPRESTQQYPAGLTSREVAVLALLASGLRNKEIAERLHRSPRTIDHHLQAVFAKLSVSSRLEAVSAARQLGVVDTQPARTQP